MGVLFDAGMCGVYIWVGEIWRVFIDYVICAYFRNDKYLLTLIEIISCGLHASISLNSFEK